MVLNIIKQIDFLCDLNNKIYVSICMVDEISNIAMLSIDRDNSISMLIGIAKNKMPRCNFEMLTNKLLEQAKAKQLWHFYTNSFASIDNLNINEILGKEEKKQ